MANVTINPFTGKLDMVGGSGGGGSGTVTSVAGGVGITNTPEPITGAGTVDLDINSLTSETTLATGDLFAFVDVSVGTSPSAQRKVTFGNIAAGLNTLGTLDHGALAGLGDDDHAQYFLLAGRAGLQFAQISTNNFGALIGGTAGLALIATTGTTLAGQPIILNGLTTDIVGDNEQAIRFGPGGSGVNIADDPGVAQARFSMLSLTGSFVVTDDSEGGPFIQLLVYAPEITNTPSSTSILDAGGQAFKVEPTYTADTDACTVNAAATGVLVKPVFATTNGGTIGGGSGYGCVDARITTDAGVSLGLVYGMFYEGVKGTGNVDTDTAFRCIDATATVNTVQQSLASSGPLRILVHRGDGIFGGDAVTPAAKLHAYEETLEDPVFRLESEATNDNVVAFVTQHRVTTTDATTTTLATFALADETIYRFEAHVIARQTGGTAGGGAGNGGSLRRVATYKRTGGGGATELGDASIDSPQDDLTNFGVVFTPSSNDALLQVTGAADQDTVWHATVYHYLVST